MALPGSPDIAFPGRKVAIFVHGCFWHAHGCAKGRAPKSRLEYWRPKLDANRERDVRKAAELAAQGWRVITVWQCETGDQPALLDRLRAFLGTEKIRSTWGGEQDSLTPDPYNREGEKGERASDRN
jgi:DNA mismatch endonuclease (patch repair protein)